MEIYIKPAKKVPLSSQSEICVKDICEVYADENTGKKINEVVLFKIDNEKDTKFLISVIEIIKAITDIYPGCRIHNVGEADTLVDYKPYKKKRKSLFLYAKIFFVTAILVAGSATAIMTFHSDAQMPAIFKKYHKIFIGYETEKPLIIDIPYSVGLAAGIIIFFNHFAGKKLTDDPTPIQVEMSLYEKDVTDTLIENMSSQKMPENGTENISSQKPSENGTENKLSQKTLSQKPSEGGD
ncbi:MAG: stage V sporulation protein AA [Clostridiales bacterium]|jgi:stage V sporulation protein AA|nr:stage V sporulation protein AA [Clostridiales bacterium]